MALILTKNAKCFLQKLQKAPISSTSMPVGSIPFLKQKLMPEHFVNACKTKFWTGLLLAHAENEMTFLPHFTASQFTPSEIQKLAHFINGKYFFLPINNTISTLTS